MIDQAFVDATAARFADCESRLSAAATENPRQLKDLTREYTRLKKLLEKSAQLMKLKDDLQEHRAFLTAEIVDPDLKGLAQEELALLEKQIPELERGLMIALLPPNPNESRNTIMEIRAGTGGNEAALFAGDLARMYTRYAETQGWQVEFIDSSPSEVGGYKEVIFSIQGDHVYRILQFEGGTHRVQRVPVTESQGRIHTSTATVAVLPEAEDLDEIEITPEDLRVDVYRASGAGGQHVNKTDSAVRLTHLPSGLVVASQEERSQHKNRAKAMRVLRSRLLDLQRRQNETEMGAARRSQIGSGDRSERIRTYNFPQNRLTDHRINFTLYNLEAVMEGGLDPILKALYDNDTAERLRRINITPESSILSPTA
ncbi:MAG: peptide chain release factor 1 [Verrucomicrobia bacterium]|nr:peptide chain release factor 1 [Verrucomicrobiota bacterium]MBU4429236.1 peptide chain release factor 1 [Verrucomicrobiota bacterium]MCG2680375.1 peptide chain release factor 1 [Kiritimatiellia bacterium]